MNKFKKAIDQLNQPIREIKINPEPPKAKKLPIKEPEAEIKTAARDEAQPKTAAEIMPEPGVTALQPRIEMADEDISASGAKDKKRAKKAAKKQAKTDKKEAKRQAKADKKKAKRQAKTGKKEAKRQAKADKKEAKREGAKAKSEFYYEKSLTEIKQNIKKRVSKEKKILIIFIVVILAVWGCFANYRLNNTLKPVFYQVKSNNVTDNVRIVAISDMHLKEFGKNNTRLVDKIALYHPDIIAIVGDMNIDDNPDYSAVINVCARLNEISPMYYCLGNHEFEAMLFEDSQIYYDLKAAGIKVLNNETETIEVGLSTIDVIGLTQGPKQFRSDAEKFFKEAMSEDDNFKLVLTHYPENFDGVIEEYPIDLAICGHAHGGQIRLPVIGGLYSSDQGFLPKLCDGYHEIENSKVIITKGLGRSGIMPRVNNAPEITIIDVNWY